MKAAYMGRLLDKVQYGVTGRTKLGDLIAMDATSNDTPEYTVNLEVNADESDIIFEVEVLWIVNDGLSYLALGVVRTVTQREVPINA